MKILIIGQFHTEGFGKHISDTFIEIGHETIHFEPGFVYKTKSIWGRHWNKIKQSLYTEVFSKVHALRHKKFKKLYSKLKSYQVDLTLVLYDYLLPEEVAKIKNLTKSPVVLWFPDAIVNFGKSAFLISEYDILYFSDKYIVNELKQTLNLNTLYLPQCFNPHHHKWVETNKHDLDKYACDITNAGNMYPNRIALYSQLLKYNIKMWGSPPAIWVDDRKIKNILMNEYVFNEEKSKAFRAAKIVLNNLHPSVIDGVNKRAFEIPACGAFQIVNHKSAIQELFDIDKEIVTFNNFNELVEKIDYYLAHETERLQIANAGMKRAHKEHTYRHRLTTILDDIKKI